VTERFSAREAVTLLTATGDFSELPVPIRQFMPDGPLAWQGYDDSRARAAARTGEAESVVCGTATIGDTPAVLIAFEFGFLGGSLGERTGDRLEAAYTYAREHRLPLVSLVATGGSRMQEGMLALTQLQRVARQSALTREAGLPQIAVLRDPTTGGGWATLGAGADVVLALSGAQVGFAGSRVRPPDADPAAYTAEAQLAAGAVDAVVRPEELPETLALWLRLLAKPATENEADAEAEILAHSEIEAESRSDSEIEAESRSDSETETESRSDSETEAETRAGNGTDTEAAPVPPALGALELPTTGWDAVQRARSPQRPRAAAYLDAYFTRRVTISGDRCGGTDDGMLCGFGLASDGRRSVTGSVTPEGRTIAYAAQCGTATRPAGYRTAARLIRLADRLGIPVLTLVDTPGAANDADAERQGAGAAIADLFAAVAAARTPVTTLVIGEGGSGGALALAAPGNTWATPDSYFSVIAPELAAAILKRTADDVEGTADQLRIRPQDLVDLGVVRGVVGDPNGGADVLLNR